MKSLRDKIAMDLNRESGRIDEMLRSIQQLQGRMDNHEQSPIARGQDGPDIGTQTNNGNEDRARDLALMADDVSIVISGLRSEDNENLLQKAQDVISALGETVDSSVTITNVHRFRSNFENKPGLVKVSFRCVDDKIRVLRNKMKLKNHENYSSVYIKSSNLRAERLIELNARAILRKLPNGHNLRLNAKGQITTNVTARQDRQGDEHQH